MNEEIEEEHFKRFAWELYKLIPKENKQKFEIFMFHEAGNLGKIENNVSEIYGEERTISCS